MPNAADRRPKTAIVHHRSGIGDLVWHLPYIRAIAQTSANGKVTVVARPSCHAVDVLAGEASVERVIEFDHRPRKSERRRGRHDSLRGQLTFLRDLRRHRFDRIYIFSNRPRYGMLAVLAGIPSRAGFGFSRFERLFLNMPPYIEKYRGSGSWVYPEATAFAVAHGFVDGPVVPKVSVPLDALKTAGKELSYLPRPLYALAIGASDPSKNWGVERFAELTRLLTERGYGVLLLGGPAESGMADTIAAQIPEHARTSVHKLTQPSLSRSMAALHHCDFCVGNDTGVLNLAAASDVVSLGLFGATAPLGHDPILHAIRASGMHRITVNDVVGRLETLAAAPLP